MRSANPGFLELRTGHTIDAPDRRRLCGVCQCGSNISKRLDCNHVSVARLQYTAREKSEDASGFAEPYMRTRDRTPTDILTPVYWSWSWTTTS